MHQSTAIQELPPKHLGYLDSVRGIAAMIVVVYHFLNWDYAGHTGVKVLNLFFNGADAVAFFFVLSGFVLSYKYVVLKEKLDVGKFAVTRFFRLWPAFFITVFINAFYHATQGGDFGWTKLVNMFVLNKNAFWEEASLIRYSSYLFYVPGWTLTIEFIMSLFVPFVIIIANNNPKNMWWLAGFFLFATPGLIGMGMFFNHFIYGVLIATY